MTGSLYSYPLSVDFDITLGCNLRCLHCNVGGGYTLKDELFLEEILHLIQELHALGVIDLSITGGEPLKRKDWLEVMAYASSYDDWRVILNTNGILWNERAIEEFKDRCKGVQVAISLDGYSAGTYGILRKDARRRPATQEFSHVLKNIALMKEYELNVTLNFMLTSLTISNFFDVMELAAGLEVNALVGIKFFPYGRGMHNLALLNPPFEQWAKFLQRVARMKMESNRYVEHISISVMCPWEFLIPLKAMGMGNREIAEVFRYVSPLNNPNYRKGRDLGCNAGITGCAISPNGQLFPCGTVSSRAPGLECGNLRERGLKDTWAHSPMLNYIRSLQLEDIAGPCQECEFAGLCGGGCRVRAHVLTGDYAGPDLDCPYVYQWSKMEGYSSALSTKDRRQDLKG